MSILMGGAGSIFTSSHSRPHFMVQQLKNNKKQSCCNLSIKNILFSFNYLQHWTLSGRDVFSSQSLARGKKNPARKSSARLITFVMKQKLNFFFFISTFRNILCCVLMFASSFLKGAGGEEIYIKFYN